MATSRCQFLRRKLKRLTYLRKLAERREGIAALEFALIAPIMIYTLLVASDIAAALNLTRHLTNAADVIAEVVSQQTQNGNPTRYVTDAILLADDASLLTTVSEVMPDAARKNEDWTSDIQAIVSSVQFRPVGTCIYQPPGGPATVCSSAYVMWSVGFTATGFTHTRTCGPTTIASANTKTPSLTTIPPGAVTPGRVNQPGTIIVVDVSYVFNPLFTKWLTGPFTFQRTAYLPPRFFTEIDYTVPNAGTPSGNNTTYSDSGMTSCTYNGP